MKNIIWCIDTLANSDATIFSSEAKEKTQAAREELATATFINKNHSCKYCSHAKVCGIHSAVIEMFEYNRDGYFSKKLEQAIEKTQQAIGSNCSNYLFHENE